MNIKVKTIPIALLGEGLLRFPSEEGNDLTEALMLGIVGEIPTSMLHRNC
jgi:hypothetical protein